MYIQLFRERLSEKVHATIPKGIVGGFQFTVFSKKFQRIAREARDVCQQVLKESNKSRFDGYSIRNSVLIISHITFRDCHVHSFPTKRFSYREKYRQIRYFCFLARARVHFSLVIVQLVKKLRSPTIFPSSGSLFQLGKNMSLEFFLSLGKCMRPATQICDDELFG